MFTTSNVIVNPLHQSIKKVAHMKLFLKIQHDLLATIASACFCFKLRSCNLSKGCLIFKTLTASNIKSTVFLDVILSSLVDKIISFSFFKVQNDRRRFLQNSGSYLQ